MKKLIRLFAIIILPVFIACENQESEKTTLKLSFKALNEILLTGQYEIDLLTKKREYDPDNINGDDDSDGKKKGNR